MNPALRKSGADMLRTMLVMLVAVGFLVLLVPRPSSVPRAVVDLSSAADQAGDVLGFAPATPVPQGWTVTSARVRRDTGDLPSWTINYLTARGTLCRTRPGGGLECGVADLPDPRRRTRG